MEAREIYHVLKSIVEPIHAHSDQVVAIAKWIEAEFEYKPQKQANGVDQSASNCNIPLVVGSALKDDERVHYEALQDCCKKILKAVDSGKVPQRGIMGLRLLMPK